MALAYQIQLYKSRIVQCPYCGCVVNTVITRLSAKGEYKSFFCLDYGHSFSETWLKFYLCGFYMKLKQVPHITRTRAMNKRSLGHFNSRKRRNV
jgi:hypothetical protein